MSDKKYIYALFECEDWGCPQALMYSENEQFLVDTCKMIEKLQSEAEEHSQILYQRYYVEEFFLTTPETAPDIGITEYGALVFRPGQLQDE